MTILGMMVSYRALSGYDVCVQVVTKHTKWNGFTNHQKYVNSLTYIHTYIASDK